MAELARDEEAWWQAELAPACAADFAAGASGSRWRPRGRRGLDSGLAIEVSGWPRCLRRLQRRLLRYAAEQLGARSDFAATEALRALALDRAAPGRSWSWRRALRAERTPRELRLTTGGEPAPKGQKRGSAPFRVHGFNSRRDSRPPLGFAAAHRG
jgi:hypothetical protein